MVNLTDDSLKELHTGKPLIVVYRLCRLQLGQDAMEKILYTKNALSQNVIYYKENENQNDGTESRTKEVATQEKVTQKNATVLLAGNWNAHCVYKK